jgi:glycine oxidase
MTDCLILGGGVIGLSLTYDLLKHGARVTLIDRRQFGGEASWAGAGILPPAGTRAPRDGYEQLAALSAKLYPQWSADLLAETGIDNGFRNCGGIYVARDEREAATLAAKATDWETQGIAVERLTVDELAEYEPALVDARSREALRAIYRLGEEAQVRNPRHVKALLAACQARGATLLPNVECHTIHVGAGHVTSVSTSAGEFTADRYCVATGAWSAPFLASLGVNVPLRPIRGQIALLHTEPNFIQHIINEGRRYLVPRDDGRILIGSTEEDAGFDANTTAAGIEGLLELATSLVPLLAHVPVERAWAGLRPGTPDGLPCLGAIPGVDNALCAAGHSRGGLQLSPATAVVVSRLIRNEPSGIDLADFRIDRFAGQ